MCVVKSGFIACTYIRWLSVKGKTLKSSKASDISLEGLMFEEASQSVRTVLILNLDLCTTCVSLLGPFVRPIHYEMVISPWSALVRCLYVELLMNRFAIVPSQKHLKSIMDQYKHRCFSSNIHFWITKIRYSVV